LFEQKKKQELALVQAIKSGDEQQVNQLKSSINVAQENQKKLRAGAVQDIKKSNASFEEQDTNYIFLTYIIDHLPIGLVGFLIAMILLASMGSMASAFGSLTSTSMVDIYQRFLHKEGSNQHYWWVSKLITLGWGVLCLIVAQFAVNMGSLIEVVNILGSWFYGTILGVFLCAFYLPRTNGNQVFWAALLAEAIVIYAWYIDLMAFLWLNVVGCLLVMAFAGLASLINPSKQKA
jgi:Na+/proline symporter